MRHDPRTQDTPLRLRHIVLARQAWESAHANADAAEARGVEAGALHGVRRLLDGAHAELSVLESIHARSPAARLTVRTYTRLTRGELMTPSALVAALASLRLARLAAADNPGLDAAERALITREIDDVAHRLARRMEQTPALPGPTRTAAARSPRLHPQPPRRAARPGRSARETV